ncbi:unnamed protein product, partial [Mesorhabditis belari]|uniref:Uncharacterized protein n=1 Tax=Mesorhabditis belari TaxID=2138241 RepID=A0AAF3EP45_9BILA
MLDLLKKAFCCQSTKRESPLSAYSLESTRRPENAIAEPPTVFAESAHERGWPELAPDAPLRWQAVIRRLPEQGNGIEIVNESKDVEPPESAYNSPRLGLDDLYLDL